jgi:hypothetical protein
LHALRPAPARGAALPSCEQSPPSERSPRVVPLAAAARHSHYRRAWHRPYALLRARRHPPERGNITPQSTVMA